MNKNKRLQNIDFSFTAWVNSSQNTGLIWYKGQSAGDNFPKYFFGWNLNRYNFHINGPGLTQGLFYTSNLFEPINWNLKIGETYLKVEKLREKK